MNTVIISAGSIQDYNYCEKYFIDAPYIICVDGGAKHLEQLNVEPNILIGDFDSIDESLFIKYKEKNIEFLTFKKDKDKTDTHLAIDYSIENKANKVILLGGYGTRVDHSLANIYMIEYAKQNGVDLMLADGKNEIILASKKTEVINDMENSFISLIPLSQKVYGVTTQNLKYQLSNATLKRNDSFGVSNEFLGEKAIVLSKRGKLLIIKSRD